MIARWRLARLAGVPTRRIPMRTAQMRGLQMEVVRDGATWKWVVLAGSRAVAEGGARTMRLAKVAAEGAAQRWHRGGA